MYTALLLCVRKEYILCTGSSEAGLCRCVQCPFYWFVHIFALNLVMIYCLYNLSSHFEQGHGITDNTPNV